MLIAAVAALLERDLQALDREVNAYPDESSLWEVPEGITNSGGTLVLHLAGNIQHFLGARLADSGYVRDRAKEFSARGVPRAAFSARSRRRGPPSAWPPPKWPTRSWRGIFPRWSAECECRRGSTWSTWSPTSRSTWARWTITGGWSPGTRAG